MNFSQSRVGPDREADCRRFETMMPSRFILWQVCSNAVGSSKSPETGQFTDGSRPAPLKNLQSIEASGITAEQKGAL